MPLPGFFVQFRSRATQFSADGNGLTFGSFFLKSFFGFVFCFTEWVRWLSGGCGWRTHNEESPLTRVFCFQRGRETPWKAATEKQKIKPFVHFFFGDGGGGGGKSVVLAPSPRRCCPVSLSLSLSRAALVENERAEEPKTTNDEEEQRPLMAGTRYRPEVAGGSENLRRRGQHAPPRPFSPFSSPFFPIDEKKYKKKQTKQSPLPFPRLPPSFLSLYISLIHADKKKKKENRPAIFAALTSSIDPQSKGDIANRSAVQVLVGFTRSIST